MKISLRRISVLVASMALVSACGIDQTSAPIAAPSEAASSSLIGGLLSSLTSVTGVQRTTPLASSITVSQTIGSAGGTLSIPAAGVTVVVPAGAVSGNVNFTMTARAGSVLAYDFAPHGITFAKPLVITQSLSGTNATVLNASALQLGYYSDPSLLTSVGALVSELLSGDVNLLNWSFSAKIQHFSGYVICTGRGGRASE